MRHPKLYINGEIVDLMKLQPRHYDLQDVAHTLSQINRFNGRTPFPYSVAQHACLVSYLCPRGLKLQGLHHDDDEAFTGDIIGPMKDTFTDIRPWVDEYIKPPIAKALGIPVTEPTIVKTRDIQALDLERYYVQGRGEYRPVVVPPGAAQLLKPMHPKQAEELYLLAHAQYSGEDWPWH